MSLYIMELRVPNYPFARSNEYGKAYYPIVDNYLKNVDKRGEVVKPNTLIAPDELTFWKD